MIARSDLILAGALYFPLIFTGISALLWGRRKRMFAACLLSLLWTLAALLALQKLNGIAGWWSFTRASAWFSGMPLELYFGWAIAWGILPQIVLRRLPI